MKKIIFGTIFSVFALALVVVPSFAAAQSCATINDGTITDSAGNFIATGYDQYGYNYQAHMFNGTYDSSDRTLDGMYWADPTRVGWPPPCPLCWCRPAW